jgi:hypothetical protein
LYSFFKRSRRKRRRERGRAVLTARVSLHEKL